MRQERWTGVGLLVLVAVLMGCAGCGDLLVGSESNDQEDSRMNGSGMADDSGPTEVATLGAGCFWCVEAVLEQVDGVLDVVSGYTGGEVKDPTYKQVCSGDSGHAEVVQVTFDPDSISYQELLEWFWQLHDPTTLNRQGNDKGSQYRSAIYYHSEQQRAAAEASKAAADASGKFDDPIVTEITAAETFYPAEVDHQEYYRLNKRDPYCRLIIAPKLDKLGLKK